MSEKRDGRDFATRLSEHITRSGYHIAQLARLADVRRTTLITWLDGSTCKPRYWQDIAKVARGLRLDQSETDELLHLAGYPPILRLKMQVQDNQEQELLSFWSETRGGKLAREHF